MGSLNSISEQISTVATSAASNAWIFGANFLVLVVLTVVMIGFTYRSGKGGIISLILAFYAGYAIYTVFPYTENIIGAGGTKVIKAFISIVLFGIATYIPYHFVQRLTSGGFGVISFVPRFALSFLTAAFLLALAYHVFNVNNIYTFPNPINTLFEPKGYFFWWFIAPMAGLMFLIH
jgi:hypothetical protein